MTDDRDPDRHDAPADKDTQEPIEKRDEQTDDNLVHFNPWRDFSDAPRRVDVFGDEPDAEQIATFMGVVFGYSEGLIPVRSFIDKGQGFDGRPHNIWVDADGAAAEKMATFARSAGSKAANKAKAASAEALMMLTKRLHQTTGVRTRARP